MQICLSSTLILPYHTQAVHKCLGSENGLPERFVLHFQKRINIIQIENGKLYGKDKCEHKAYPHKVCADRSHIRSRVNGALND